MANPTMEEIVNAVTTEVRFGSGVSVQVHLEPSIVQNVSRAYRTLMKKYVFRDYYTVTDLVIDEATGQAIIPMAGVLDSFSNIIGVYEENHLQPLPYAPVMGNPRMLRRPALVPASNGQIFTIYPINKQRNVTLIAKVYQTTDFEMDDEVPFYKDLLVLCATWKLMAKAGVNPDYTKELEKEYKDLLQEYVMDELQDHYQLNSHVGHVPTEWSVV